MGFFKFINEFCMIDLYPNKLPHAGKDTQKRNIF